MTTEPKLHLAAQQAASLLGPLEATVRHREAQAEHNLARVALASPAAAALAAAGGALRDAAARIAAAASAKPEPGRAAAPASGRKRVLLTGAGGRIGSDLAVRLAEHDDLRLMRHRAVPEAPPADDWVVADTATVEGVLPAMAGIDAVAHLAGEPSATAPWERVREANIVGARSVFEAARLAGVRRVVFASTNHVMGLYDRDRDRPVYSDQPVRPDSPYGASEAFGEALGRHYADQHGLGVVCLRIGWWLPAPKDAIAAGMWPSPRDCTQIVRRAIDSDLRCGIFYAISANAGRHWDITDAIERPGYRHEDDASRGRPTDE